MTGEGTGRGEFQLIAELFSPLARGAKSALGLKDDAAVLDVPAGHQLVVTADTVIAGVHFRADDPPELVARKALRVNLSDLAAKGAKPYGFLQALALNTETSDAYLEKYAAGLKADVEAFAIPLLGGDTTAGPGPLSISITAFGLVETGTALLRGGASAGDIIYVSGTIGDGALGLACLEGTLEGDSYLAADLIARYHLPQPRFEVGLAIKGIASACLDISDGLVADVGHICEVSGLAATLEREKIPLSKAARRAVAQDTAAWKAILAGGDDYELAFTVAPERVSELDAISQRLSTPLTVIGVMGQGSGITVFADGQPFDLNHRGFQHR
jgi:thiamine-monophosphate kinase